MYPLYVLGIKPWSFGRELNNEFNHWAVYPGPAMFFLQFFYLSEIVSSEDNWLHLEATNYIFVRWPSFVWKPFMEKCYRLRSDPQRQIVDQAWQSWEDRPIPFRIPGSHLFFRMIYFVTVISTVTPEKWVPTWNSRHRVASCLFCLLRLEGGCSYDYILLFDGPEYNSSLIARVCNGASGTFTSTRNFMSVVFITDVSVTLRGFQANYIAVYVPSTSEFHCENECALVFGGAFWSSVFQSLWHKQYHGLPGSYACLLWRGTVCSWSGGSDWQKDGWGTALADGRNTGFSVIIRK